ncbi:hypothetical protein KI659_01060 [Litoribacter alkaliphilus]|uniref:Type II toxin-antitoxin system HicB family antitoxin n=1 Tax=Litoribacter ruber TaxID=702568 RepID=A0AAP2G2R3_9BACT|nr:hypothetical protein [Litoribacter alkaliphilus]MBS9522590.1 hypothetical protein [Litoribacter alkaliphilus]
MGKVIVKGDKSGGSSNTKTQLSLLSFEENGVVIIYCPALDLSGYGKTEEEAMKSFQLALSEFIDFCTKNNTFHRELKRLGWQIQQKDGCLTFESPSWNHLIQTNEELEDLLEKKHFHKFDQEISFPALP